MKAPGRWAARLAAVTVMLLTPVASYGGKPRSPRVYSPASVGDLEDLAKVLKRHVAHITVTTVPPPDQPLYEPERDGYGIVLEKDLVAALCFLVQRAKRVEIRGPLGVTLPGDVVLYDVKRRVALIRTRRPLAQTGLVPATMAPKTSRKVHADVFTLVATDDGAGVVNGALTELGEMPEYEGHPRIDLVLERGMPVFDNQARFLGYSRVVSWDHDRHMIIPQEMIRAARTATGAASKDELRRKESRPWWAK